MNLYLDSLIFTANIVAPIFFIVFLGVLLSRQGMLGDEFISAASRLVFSITLPALVFIAIADTHLDQVLDIQLLLFVVGFTLLSFALIWAIGRNFIARGADLGAFVQGAYRSNFGIIGLAVSLNLFGQAGLATASVLLALIIPLYNVLAVIVLSVTSGQSMSLAGILKRIILNPLILAVLAALPFAALEISLPGVAHRTGEYFAQMTLPLALLTIGASLNLRSLRATGMQAFNATLIKLVVMPATGVPLALLLGFSHEHAAHLLVLFACPTAAASFVMARAMGANAQLAANIVATTTLGSVFTLSGGIYMLRIGGLI